MTVAVSSESAPENVAERRMPRLLRAVPSEPPFDESVPTVRALVAIDGQLQLAFTPESPARFASPASRPVLTLIPSPEADRHDVHPQPGTESRVDAELRALFGARRTSRQDLPDPRARAAAAVRILLEVLAGDRPARQVAGWVSPTILERLEQHRVTPTHRRSRLCCVRSLHVSEPSDAVAEIAAVIAHDGAESARRRAVAMRMEGREGRWLVTAFVVG